VFALGKYRLIGVQSLTHVIGLQTVMAMKITVLIGFRFGFNCAFYRSFMIKANEPAARRTKVDGLNIKSTQFHHQLPFRSVQDLDMEMCLGPKLWGAIVTHNL